MKSRSLRVRLANQLASRGVSNSQNVADNLLEKRGHMKNGKLTKEGKVRQQLGAAGRAKDRAAKYSGGKSSDFKYNPNTNRATKKK